MSVTKRKRSTRGKKIALWVFAGLMVFGTVRFMMMRAEDRTAWPAGAPGVSFERAPSPSPERLATPADVAAVMDGFTAAEPALIEAYRLYQARGVTNGIAYPDIDARLGDPGSRLSETLAFWRRFDGFDPQAGSMPHNAFIGASAEHAILACYAVSVGRPVDGLPADPAEVRLAVLANAVKLTHGGGLVGRHAALNNTMLVVRELIMDPLDFADFSATTSYVARVRVLEGAIGDLRDALRTDRISIQEAVAVLYGTAPDSTVPVGGKSLGRFGSRIVRLLGGNHADTQAHVDALFSRLIRNAPAAYTEVGLAKGLPAWCRGDGRAPSTRDPIGAAVTGAYMRHAVFAHAVAPSLLLELRAARLAIALAAFARENGGFPEAIRELVDTGLLESQDLIDPFATDGESFLNYARDGEGWRFYSVGLDQVDGGGRVDAYRAGGADSQQATDFVFVSRERASRLAMQPEGKL